MNYYNNAKRALSSLTSIAAIRYFPDAYIDYVSKKSAPKIKRDDNNVFSLSEIADELDGCDTISFDFFDTVASRRCSLAQVFEKTAEFAASTVASDNGPIPKSVFLAARGRIADYVKKHQSQTDGRNEVNISELFERALRPYIASKKRREFQAQRIVDFETRFEISQLVVDDEFLPLVKIIRDLKKRVILITDMYLPAANIHQILIELGLEDTFDHVFVSATVGVTKNSGLLFDYVSKNLDSAPETFLHIGDNFVNDFVQPRAHGWNVLHLFNSKNVRVVHALQAKHHVAIANIKYRDQQVDESLKSGCLAQSGQSKSKALADLANNVMAPAFAIFAHKVLVDAQKNGLSRLYFLTRDGTLFRAVADIINSRSHILDLNHTKISTLAISRSTSFLLRFEDLENLDWAEEAVSWMKGKPLTLRNLLNCFDVSEQELEGVKVAYNEFQDSDLDIAGRGAVAELLSHQTKLRKALERLLTDRKLLFIKYLKQEGVFGPGKIGFVDIGYSGTAIKFLSEYLFGKKNLEKFGKIQMHCYFFATNRFFPRNLDQMHPGVIMNPGMVISHEQSKDAPLIMNFGWLEQFTVDPDLGKLRCFKQDGDQVQPIFDKSTQSEFRQEIRRIILARAADLADVFIHSPIPFGLFEEKVKERLRKFVTKPTFKNVKAMENLMHDFGIADSRDQSVIQTIPIYKIPPNLNKLMREDKWLQGSLKKSGLGIFIPLINKWARTIR